MYNDVDGVYNVFMFNNIVVTVDNVTYTITVDKRSPKTPYVGGRINGKGETFRASSLDAIFSQIADEIRSLKN